MKYLISLFDNIHEFVQLSELLIVINSKIIKVFELLKKVLQGVPNQNSMGHPKIEKYNN